MILDSDRIELRAVLAILKRQKRLLLLTVALVLGLAVTYLLIATPIYRSTVLLQVDGRNSNLLDPSGSGQEQAAILNARVDGEVEILRSDATALAVVLAANLMQDPEFGPRLGWLEKLWLALGKGPDADAQAQAALVNDTLQSLQDAVDVRRRGLTYLVGISVLSQSPQKAALIANAYAKTYIERQVGAKTEAMIVARDVLRRQTDTAQADLAASERAVNGFIETNLSRLEVESGDPTIADLRQRLSDAKRAQAASSARIATAEAAVSAGDWPTVASTLGDQAIAELARQRAETQRSLGSGALAPDKAMDVRAELARLDKDLAATSNATLMTVRAEISTLRERERGARDTLRTQLLQSDLSAEMLSELFNLQQSATAARNQYQTLLARVQDLGALANLQIADARIVSEALAPNAAAAPNPRLIVAVALVGGLGMGVLFVFLTEYFIGGVISASQLGNVMQAPVPISVAAVDPAKSGGDPAKSIFSAPMSVYAEGFRKLRATVDMGLSRCTAPDGRARVILVCSALQAEGKTTTAIALARTYALSGSRTLLIDADLRRPSVAGRLGLGETAGLIDFLTHARLDETRNIKTAIDPLSSLVVMGAGARSSMPTDQLLNSDSFRAMLDVVATRFDIVIIDSPPLLPVVDTRYLARYADAVVHVVRYGSTTQGEVREAAAQIREFLPRQASYCGILNLAEPLVSRYEGYDVYAYDGAVDA